MDDITSQEKKIVDELRRRTLNDVTPKMLEDLSLFYRFAKACNFNLVEAEVMLRKHIEWRKEVQFDTLSTEYEPPEVLVNYGPASFMGFDKEKCFVWLIDGGRADITGLTNAATKLEIMKYIAYLLEQDRERIIEHVGNLGKPRYWLLFDMEEFSYATAVNIKTVEFVIFLLKVYMGNYPETLRRLTCFNAPFYFSWLFAAIKPFFPPAIISKIQIFGSDGWKEFLKEHIDSETLPVYLGGNKTDPDGNPLCESFLLRGRPIPKSYYKNKSKKFYLEPDVQKLTLLPFSKQEITFKVKEENSFLEWEFQTKNSDVNFSLVYQEESAKEFEPLELIPRQRVDTFHEAEKGCFNCTRAGNYMIVFDNSFSWLRTKEVYYRVGIRCPMNNKLDVSI